MTRCRLGGGEGAKMRVGERATRVCILVLAGSGCGGSGASLDAAPRPDAAPLPDAGVPDATPRSDAFAFPDANPDALSGFDAFLRGYQEMICDREVECGLAPDLATCAEASAGSFYRGQERLEASITAGRVRFDRDAARRCLDATGAATCLKLFRGGEITIDCWHVTAPDQGLDEPCTVLAPNVPAADRECDRDLECTIPAGCDSRTSCCAGTCVQNDGPRGLDDHCDSTHACRDALTCIDGICTLPSAEGAACLGTCVGPLRCTSGACEPLPDVGAEGEACFTDDADLHCEPGLACAGGVCARGPGLGDLCGVDNSCAMGTYCSPVTQHCAPAVHLGGSCADTERACLATGYLWNACKRGICQAPLSTGAACLDAGDCKNAVCGEDGMCAPPLTCP